MEAHEWYSIAGFLVGMIIVLMPLASRSHLPLTTNIIPAIFMGDGTLTGGLDAMPPIVSNAVDSVAIFALIPVPLFIIMGELFFHTDWRCAFSTL